MLLPTLTSSMSIESKVSFHSFKLESGVEDYKMIVPPNVILTANPDDILYTAHCVAHIIVVVSQSKG